MEQHPNLESLYQEAQKALAAKDFERARDLLKQILLVDENYKDASKLLAGLVEQQRRRWYQNRWLWGSIGAAAIVALGILLAGKLPSQPSSPTQPLMMSTSTPIPASQTPTSIPTVASPTPSVTPTAIPLVWERIWIGQELTRGSITTIAFDPIDPDILYVGMENTGIYKSIDGGLSWQPAHSGMGRTTVFSLVVDPENPAILYAGTELDGVYKTEDQAQTWRAVNQGIKLPGWNWRGLVLMDKRDNRHLYYDHGFDLYETLDAGETWHNRTGTMCPYFHFNLVLHPEDGQILFMQGNDNGTGCQEGVYESRDGGRTWDLIQETEPLANWAALAIDGTTGSHLYAADQSSLYASTDGGSNWSIVFTHPCDVVVFTPDNNQMAYCGFGGTLQETRNGGITWRVFDDATLTALAISPHDSQLIWVGGKGLVFSNDGGESWVERSSGLGAGHVELRIDPVDNSILYLETSTGWLYRSLDGGRNWALIEDQGSGLEFDKSAGALFRSVNGGIQVSRDKGDTWEKIQSPNVFYIGTNPQKPGMLYAIPNQCATESPIYVSTDDGKTWTENMGYVPCDRTRFFVGSGEGQRVYMVGDVEISRSDDAGYTWRKCEPLGYAARFGSRLTIDPRDDDHLYFASRASGVLVSENGCGFWRPSNEGMSSLFVNSIAIDPINPDTLYAGTDSGAYISFNGGETWNEINDGLLGATVVYSIVVDSDSNVYAATPYGVFKLGSK